MIGRIAKRTIINADVRMANELPVHTAKHTNGWLIKRPNNWLPKHTNGWLYKRMFGHTLKQMAKRTYRVLLMRKAAKFYVCAYDWQNNCSMIRQYNRAIN